MIRAIAQRITRNRNPRNTGDREHVAAVSGVLGVFVNLVLFALKGFLGLFTGSIALIADAFNNLGDMASSIITIIGFKLAGMEPDEEHPYGHGRMEHLTGLTVSVLILFVGYQFIVSSFRRILSPQNIQYSPLVIGLLLVSVLAKVFLYALNRRLGQDFRAEALLATATDALGDVFATLVVVLGLLLSRVTPLPVDGVIGLLIAFYILRAGIHLTRKTISPLLGEKPDPALARDIKKRIVSYDNIYGVHDLEIHNYGPSKTMAVIHAEVPHDMDLVELHNLVDKIERHVWDDFHVSLVIHVDPVNMEDEEFLRNLQHVTEIALSEEKVLSIHDFRYTGHPKEALIIFEAVVEAEKTTKSERQRIVKSMERNIRKAYPDARVIITLDLDVSML